MAKDQTLAGRYKALSALQDADAQERRKAGLEFEKLLNALFEREKLSPRMRYRPEGEEIDGSFILEARVFLVEAKWHSEPLPASAIYAFRGKVEGKLTGTLGVFISSSGYSSHAVDALILGKSLNIILFDRQDLDAIFLERVTFTSIIQEKLRIAAEEGTVYLTRDAAAEHRKQQAPKAEKRLAAVVAEGRGDMAFLAELLERLPLRSKVPVVGAGGKMATAKLANFLLSTGSGPGRVIVVVDADGDVAGSKEAITQLLESPDKVDVVVVENELESWIPDTRVRLGRLSPPQIYELANGLDLDLLRTRSESYRRFESLVLAATGGA